MAPLAPSEGDSCLALAGAGCPGGGSVLQRLLTGSTPAAAAGSRAQPASRKGFKTVANTLSRYLGVDQPLGYGAGHGLGLCAGGRCSYEL